MCVCGGGGGGEPHEEGSSRLRGGRERAEMSQSSGCPSDAVWRHLAFLDILGNFFLHLGYFKSSLPLFQNYLATLIHSFGPLF